LANFINGELYGTPGNPPWAVKFPLAVNEDLATPGKFGPHQATDGLARFNSAEPVTHFESSRQLADAVRDDPGIKAKAGELLTPRHPSQIYEALLEGALLFAILLIIRLRYKKLAHGMLTGLFFLIYAIVRIIGEEFRQPDSERILGMTAGQFYSLFMVAAGLLFLGFATWNMRRQAGMKPGVKHKKSLTGAKPKK
jgi:phosphatidylglycerol:prolipoprotein diacylglycerol transferase